MSFSSSAGAMIASLRNNKNLRLNRTKYFDKDTRNIQTEAGNREPLAYKHLTKKEIHAIREEISDKNKVEILKKITAVIIAIMLVAALMFLFMKYFDVDFIT